MGFVVSVRHAGVQGVYLCVPRFWRISYNTIRAAWRECDRARAAERPRRYCFNPAGV